MACLDFSYLCWAELAPDVTLRGRLGGTLRRVPSEREADGLDGATVGFLPPKKNLAPTAATIPTPASTTPAMRPVLEADVSLLLVDGRGDGLLERARLATL